MSILRELQRETEAAHHRYFLIRVEMRLSALQLRLGNAAEAKSLYPSFMQRIVANFDNGWEMTSADIDAAIAALRGDRAA